MERLGDADLRAPSWKWCVCGILLLATMLNYMDRQTLAMTITDIRHEQGLTKQQYGELEMGFGLAFACGGLVAGFLADRMSVRLLYPLVLTGWSLAGLATAHAVPIGTALVSLGCSDDVPACYWGLLFCRTVLGFFEAGQWPCALVTSQRLLTAQQRPLGNSLLQSGAALGAILTPLVVRSLTSSAPGSWQRPFQVIGAIGLLWIVPWLWLVRQRDLRKPPDSDEQAPSENETIGRGLRRRFALLILTVIMINLCFHVFRAWLPDFLREAHDYDRDDVNLFTSFYFAAADIGCLSAGFVSKRLVSCGWPLHRARMLPFFVCACLTSLSTVVAGLPRGPLLLGLLLLIGFGALGLFPSYYSLTQELSTRHQGKVTGALGCTTWVCTALMQRFVGERIEKTHSYADGIFFAGLLPLVACLALALFWNWPRQNDHTTTE
ncbi:MAG TPA: MFS transporter [Pirellulales bacterium]|nr:MFS transporter [Pirellulales bacterium]